MTTVVGVENEDVVVIVGDSLGINMGSGEVVSRACRKTAAGESLGKIFGFSGSSVLADRLMDELAVMGLPDSGFQGYGPDQIGDVFRRVAVDDLGIDPRADSDEQFENYGDAGILCGTRDGLYLAHCHLRFMRVRPRAEAYRTVGLTFEAIGSGAPYALASIVGSSSCDPLVLAERAVVVAAELDIRTGGCLQGNVLVKSTGEIEPIKRQALGVLT